MYVMLCNGMYVCMHECMHACMYVYWLFNRYNMIENG